MTYTDRIMDDLRAAYARIDELEAALTAIIIAGAAGDPLRKIAQEVLSKQLVDRTNASETATDA